MLKICICLLLLTLVSCGSSTESDRAHLEKIYIALMEIGTPGEEPNRKSVEELRKEIDSLGGPAVVESLMTVSMMEESERWSSLLDSLSAAKQ